MSDNNLAGIVKSEAYQSLASKRKRISYTLTGINVLAYSIYVLCMAFARDFMSTPVAGALNIGIVMVIFMILFAAIISGYYVWWTNKRYDPALKSLLSSLDQRAKA